MCNDSFAASHLIFIDFPCFALYGMDVYRKIRRNRYWRIKQEGREKTMQTVEIKKTNFVNRKKLENISMYLGFSAHLRIEAVKDHRVRRHNVDECRELCYKCDGTGNECYIVYRECDKCLGKGYTD